MQSEESLPSYFGYQKTPLSATSWTHFPRDKRIKWYVTEKVHGSCFCVILNPRNHEIQFAKRNKLIKEEESFFGFRDILPDLIPKLERIGQLVIEERKTVPERIQIYGELFGGGDYPGIASNYKAVQSGIVYSPNLHFYAFDVSVITSSHTEEYLDYERSLEIFRSSHIFYAEPLATYPTFEKAIQHRIGFNSTIPRRLGLPEPSTNNKAEGIVVRSSKGHYLVKIKIPEFSESKYDENEYDSKEDKAQTPLEMFQALALKEMTRNRLNNAISKVGDFENNREEVYELFVDDILLEINGFHIFGLRERLLERVKEDYP